ncbi:P protein [Santa barbara virus]|uniref:P protein n=1 Tax=Santa barbara virus TaxID=1552661 RepID=A0A097A589_9RHAB|nr:P protein [Santa barbara virus]AIS40846.1 P protein [Santa barbara virus]
MEKFNAGSVKDHYNFSELHATLDAGLAAETDSLDLENSKASNEKTSGKSYLTELQEEEVKKATQTMQDRGDWTDDLYKYSPVEEEASEEILSLERTSIKTDYLYPDQEAQLAGDLLKLVEWINFQCNSNFQLKPRVNKEIIIYINQAAAASTKGNKKHRDTDQARDQEALPEASDPNHTQKARETKVHSKEKQNRILWNALKEGFPVFDKRGRRTKLTAKGLGIPKQSIIKFEEMFGPNLKSLLKHYCLYSQIKKKGFIIPESL